MHNSKKIVFSSLYAISQLSLGLLLHPYQTMQSIIHAKTFVFLTVLPTGSLAIITILWRLLVVPAVRLVFSCSAAHWLSLPCAMLPFLGNWLTFACIYWQILLLYLCLRFTWAYRRAAG